MAAPELKVMAHITRREVREIIESKLTEKAAVREAFRRGFARGVAQEQERGNVAP